MAFHVPEASRWTNAPNGYDSDSSCGNNGVFRLPSPEPGWTLEMICSDGLGWEHVSVHARRGDKPRTPTWKEMCAVKDACWDDEDVVIQYHPAKSEYVNNHPHVLHLWRPTQQSIPIPDSLLVGLKVLA